MITPMEIEQLFGKNNPLAERSQRLDRRAFPPTLILPMRYEVDQLREEYFALQKKIEKNPAFFENQVVTEVLGLSQTYIPDWETYWPLTLSEHSPLAIEIQEGIDHRRGENWKEHQRRISLKQRLKSLQEFDENYDPMIDERLCNHFNPLIEGTYIEELLSQFKAKVTRTRFIYLKPGARVKLHTDYDPSYSIRAHFPLTTNDKCFNGYQSAGSVYKFHMRPGQVYVVNNGIPHFAENLGQTGRLHLIVSLDGQEDYLLQREACQIPTTTKFEPDQLDQ